LPPILSPPLPVLSPAPPPSPIRSLGYRAVMIRLRAEAVSTSYSLPLQPPSASRREDIPEVTLPPQKRLEREVDYGITDSWDEIVETLQGAPTERQLLAGRLNMLFRDRRAHASTRHLMETEARMSREAWVRSTDASDLVHGEVMSLRTTVLARDALRSTNGDDSHNSRTGVRRTERATRECTYTNFLKCQPLPFKGTEGVASLSQWCERMESVFHISNYAVENQVKFATCTLHSVALTWWNTHVQTVGHEAAYGM
nr:hypothetical protein [Tanacetum cinerariifolium]